MALFSRPSSWLYHEGTCYEVGHTWHPSCLYSFADLFCIVFWEGFKIYLPLYLIVDVFRRKSPRSILLHTFPQILRSSLFLAINGGGFVGFICLLRKLIGKFYFLSSAFLPSLLASFLAILVERKGRRGMLMGYVGTVAVETLYRMIKYRGMIQPVPGGDVMLFSMASSVLLCAYRLGGLSNVIDSGFKFLFNPQLPVKWLAASTAERRLASLHGKMGIAHFIGRTALVCLWSFLIGYLIQSALSLLSLGRKLLQNPTARLKQALTNRYNVQFGMFLASLTGLFKLMNSAMFMLAVPRKVRLIISGLIAGLSMGFIRSSAITLYMGAKALEMLFFKAVERGWCRSYYYADVLLYSVFTAVIFHAAMFEAHNLRLGYWKFVVQASHNRISYINTSAIDIFGTEASTMIRLTKAQHRMENNTNTHTSRDKRQRLQNERRPGERGGEGTDT